MVKVQRLFAKTNLKIPVFETEKSEFGEVKRMITKHVVVLPYDEHWTRDFCEIKSEIQEALDQLALVIEHVGSTSVHGLSAKTDY